MYFNVIFRIAVISYQVLEPFDIDVSTPSEEKDVLVCITTATQLSCNYTGTWLHRTSQV